MLRLLDCLREASCSEPCHFHEERRSGQASARPAWKKICVCLMHVDTRFRGRRPTDRRARLIHVGTKIRTEKQENFVKDFETPYIVQYEMPFASRSGLVCRFKRELLAQV